MKRRKPLGRIILDILDRLVLVIAGLILAITGAAILNIDLNFLFNGIGIVLIFVGLIIVMSK